LLLLWVVAVIAVLYDPTKADGLVLVSPIMGVVTAYLFGSEIVNRRRASAQVIPSEDLRLAARRGRD
jgi:hypothetical protein